MAFTGWLSAGGCDTGSAMVQPAQHEKTTTTKSSLDCAVQAA